jgi:sec-independent protein translocase protein TatA
MTLPLFYPLFLPTLGPLEVVILLVIILILFGPGKLPQVFGELGKGVRQFKEASKDVTDQVNKELQGDSGKPDNNESSNS